MTVEFIAEPQLMVGEAWDDYGLIDSGHGRKYERYGRYRFIRPEPLALWQPRLHEWPADGEFVPGSDEDGGGRWDLSPDVPEDGWTLRRREAKFTAQCTPFRHLGFFPDMAPVWDWMGDRLHSREGGSPPPPAHDQTGGAPPLPGNSVTRPTMNLFGYTGVGSLALGEHGPVAHVDASKKSVAQARENAAMSGMEERPIRWLVDDAMKFAAREVRRGNFYDGIILDPPKFGRGPKNETWRIEEGLPDLIGDCAQLLDGDSRFLFLTVYAVRMSALSLGQLLAEKLAHLPGRVEFGELAIREEGEDARTLPTALFARWSNL